MKFNNLIFKICENISRNELLKFNVYFNGLNMVKILSFIYVLT